jgi:hypothetical protein
MSPRKSGTGVLATCARNSSCGGFLRGLLRGTHRRSLSRKSRSHKRSPSRPTDRRASLGRLKNSHQRAMQCTSSEKRYTCSCKAMRI